MQRQPKRRRRILWRTTMTILAGWALAQPAAMPAANLVAIGPLGLRLAPGFRIALWADAALANDIRALTFDSQGRVVVTGPGYIRTLLDTDGNGAADTTIEFAPLATAGQALCFDGSELLCVADGGLHAFNDGDRDGQADGPPRMVLPMDPPNGPVCGLRKGPDGAIYLLAGNTVNFTHEHVSGPNSPVRTIEGGALLRLRPDGRGTECVAHGFHNAAGFDFNDWGDVFTLDGDAPGDWFLPWYLPARLYHVRPAAHHGWRLRGARHTWPRPPYSPDTAGVLATLGPAVPAGVVCYRHHQFPTIFRNGLFFCDWLSGRIYFTSLTADGAEYTAAPDVFLEPVDTVGFTPVALAVAPDGALMVATGGARTRGAIYRIDFPPGSPEVAERAALNEAASLISLSPLPVLNAPQPAAAWSHDGWMGQVDRLGPEPLAQAAADPRQPPPVRVRAIEVLTELYDGLAPDLAAVGADSPYPVVRARVAWSLGRFLPPNGGPLLVRLSRDPAPLVRRRALDALADHAPAFDNATLQQGLGANLAHPNLPVRQAAARLASLLPDPAWGALWARLPQMPLPSRLTLVLAYLERQPASVVRPEAVEALLPVFNASRDPAHHLEALRLMIRALGDYRLENPTLEAYAPFEPGADLANHQPLLREIQEAVHAVFPSQEPRVNLEAARLLAMLRDNTPATGGHVLDFIRPASAAADDLHHLIVWSRLTGPLPTNAGARVAAALLGLDGKLEGRQFHPRLRWQSRVLEVVPALLKRDPSLPAALLRHPAFATPAHVFLTPLLSNEDYARSLQQLFAAARAQPKQSWPPLLVDLIAPLPAAESQPVLRALYAQPALRESVILSLAQKPEAVDRDKFVAGLSAGQDRVVQASLVALLKLPAIGDAPSLLPALRLLRQLCQVPTAQTLRAQALALIEKETRHSFRIRDVPAAPEQLEQLYEPVFDACQRRYPQRMRQLDGPSRDHPVAWDLRLKSVVWDLGDAARGQDLFRGKGCHWCHNTEAGLGPRLTGVTGRYSPPALLKTIVFPSRHVAAPYRNTTFQTRNRRTFSGLVVAETAETVLVQTAADVTVRLPVADIVSRQLTMDSLMPAGLLSDLKLPDLADLYSYLKSL